MLTRDAILSADDLKRETVEVAEWGGSVCVRALSGSERDQFELAMYNAKGNASNVRASLAARTICDKEGKRLFTDADVEVLGRKSGAALERVFNTARRLSGISTADVDELEKN